MEVRKKAVRLEDLSLDLLRVICAFLPAEDHLAGFSRVSTRLKSASTGPFSFPEKICWRPRAKAPANEHADAFLMGIGQAGAKPRSLELHLAADDALQECLEFLTDWPLTDLRLMPTFRDAALLRDWDARDDILSATDCSQITTLAISGVDDFSRFASLRKLEIGSCGSGHALSSLINLPHLRELHVSMPAGQLGYLGHLQQLTSLHLDCIDELVVPYFGRDVERFDCLRKLRLHEFSATRCTGLLLDALKSSPLRSLKFAVLALQTFALLSIADYWPNLEALEVSDLLSDKSIKLLTPLTRLKSLILPTSSLSDAAVPFLGVLKSLRHFCCRGSMTARGFSALYTLPLQTVHITTTQCDDYSFGLTSLDALQQSTTLQELTFVLTISFKPSSEVLNVLKSKLPRVSLAFPLVVV